MLLLPALNDMIDLSATRAFATLMHPPPAIHLSLIALAIIGAFLAGLDLTTGSRRSWVHPLSFAAIMPGAVFLTIDLEYPRRGLVRIDGFEKAVIDLSFS